MPESLTAPARDALAAAAELADLCTECSSPDDGDWDARLDTIRALVRRIDAGRHVIAAVLDAHKPAGTSP